MENLLRYYIALVIPFLVYCPAVFAQPAFTQEQGVRLSSASLFCVTPSSPSYRMYYTSDSYGILSATSTDGISWKAENGVRLSTSPNSLDAGAIASAGMYFSSQLQGWRMYYVGISLDAFAFNLYTVLSATSTDGLNWFEEPGVRLQIGQGYKFVTSLAPYQKSGSVIELYYVRDTAGSLNPGDFRIFRAESRDSGLTFSEQGGLLPGATAYSLCVSTLTDSRIRIFYSSTLSGETTASVVLSAISPDAFAFTQEAGVRFSTPSVSAAIGMLAVARSTETFRWRLYPNIAVSGAAIPGVYSAVTASPFVAGVTPKAAYQTDTQFSLTVAGEIFSTAAAVTVFQGSTNMPVSAVNRTSDLKITLSANPFGQPLGYYTVKVTNAAGDSNALANAFLVDFRPGYVTLTDNLFRPLKGGQCKIDAVVFNSGDLSARVYTLNGRFVKEIFNASVPAGTTTFYWKGDTESGNTVASGMYMLFVTGPKLNTTEKIVVIK